MTECEAQQKIDSLCHSIYLYTEYGILKFIKNDYHRITNGMKRNYCVHICAVGAHLKML